MGGRAPFDISKDPYASLDWRHGRAIRRREDRWIKRLACGYRNRERFRNAIYFHPGGLALYPDWLPTRNPEAAFSGANKIIARQLE